MRTRILMVAALFSIPFLQAQQAIPVGNAAAGKAAWSAGRLEGATLCWICHGEQGQGAYGPDLAGRAVTPEQFQRAVRKPWGVMPAFGATELSDQMVADIGAYMASLPGVREPGAWRLQLPPADAPRGQMLVIANGCAQCHGAELSQARAWLGGRAKDSGWPLFSKIIYEHTELFPKGRMGTFSRLRLPESTLQEIFHWLTDDLGIMVPISARLEPGVASGGNTTYKLIVRNRGIKSQGGLSAEDVTVAVALAPGTKVVSGSGPMSPQIKPDMAMWQVPSIAAEEEQTYSLTVSGTGAPAQIFNAKDSVVRWSKPSYRKAVSTPPGKDLQTAIAFPSPEPER